MLINISYLALCLRSPLLQKFMWNGVKQNAQPCLYLAVSNSLPIPLPPLAEQHRVVAKVDELMALCDQLEAQHNNAAEAHEKLVSHLLGTLTESQRAADFSGNWQRIAAHFDTLFTTEASIDALKQTLLQLAVMGKLAPQDPKDEPASELLKRIRAKKVKMISNGKLKRQKPLPPISEEEKAFELPKNWVWCRLTEIVYILGDGLHGTPEYSNAGQYHFINGNNLIDGSIIIKPETKRVAQDQYEKYKKALAENSVLVSINGTLGNVAFFKNEEVVLGKSACYFNLHEEIDKQFVKLVIEAPCFTQYAKLHATGSTIKNLGLLAMNSLPIALPPPDEQRRIVSEMNYLMLVCDHLKSSLTDGRKLQLRLVEKFIMQAVA
jgi:type I restriction enzyme S subunit